VLNSGIADIQITAEQLMREAFERQDTENKPPRQKITDVEELEEYQLKKRTEFENAIRLKRHSINIWLRYAKWEESQNEFERARSIYERTLLIDYKNVGVWLKYAEMEMKNKNINLARNLWDKAVALLPRANALWYKYIYMEERISNFVGARRLYERWMEWEPDEKAWYSYIAFERKNGETELVRNIFRRFIQVHHKVSVSRFISRLANYA
jgi:crooked neck